MFNKLRQRIRKVRERVNKTRDDVATRVHQRSIDRSIDRYTTAGKRSKAAEGGAKVANFIAKNKEGVRTRARDYGNGRLRGEYTTAKNQARRLNKGGKLAEGERAGLGLMYARGKKSKFIAARARMG